MCSIPRSLLSSHRTMTAFRNALLTRRRLALLAALLLLSPFYTLYSTYYLLNPVYPPAYCALEPSAPRIRFHQLAGCQFNNQLEELLWAHYAAHTVGRVLEYAPLKRQQWLALNDRVPLTSFFVLDPYAGCEVAQFERYPDENVRCAQEAGYTVIPDFLPLENRLEGLQSLVAASPLNISSSSPRPDSLYVAQRTFEWDYLTDSTLRPHIPRFIAYLKHTLHLRYHPRITLPAFLAASDTEPYLAVHFRRGDFEAHCALIAERRIPPVYMATHAARALPQPARDAWHRPLENEAATRAACYPTVAAFATLVLATAAEHGLRRVHVLHNAGSSERRALLALLRTDALDVSDSADVPVPVRERTEMSIAVDMLVATRARVFLGNRWSSVSGNVAVMRAVEGREAVTFFY
jgi:hypothetical protein